MKKIVLTFFLAFFPLITYCQNIQVVSFKEDVNDLSARTNPLKDNNGVDAALLKVQWVENKTEFNGYVLPNGIIHKTSEYWVYIANGAKKIKITTPGFLPLEIQYSDFGINALESKHTYRLILKKVGKDFFKHSGAYLEAGYQVGSFMGPAISVGGYIYNVNLEFDYAYGMQKSENIYWNNQNDGKPTVYSYTPQYIGGKLGYGIMLTRRLRLTPQVGAGVSMIKGSEISKGTISGIDKTYALNAGISAKLNFAVTPWMAIAITPEYDIAVKKGNIYESLSAVSSKIKGFGQGFNCRMGINFYF